MPIPRPTLTPAHYNEGFALLFVLLWSTGFMGARLGLPHAEPLTAHALHCGHLAVDFGGAGGMGGVPGPW